MKRFAPLVLLVLGGSLLALSTAWVSLFPPTSYWTDDDAAELEVLNKHIYDLYYRMSPEQAAAAEDPDRQPSAEPTPYERAVAARDAHRTKRDTAMTQPKQIATMLRWGGLGVLATGVVAFYIAQH